MPTRPYVPSDFASLYALEEICFQPPIRWPRSHMRSLVSSANAATWISEDSGQLTGFAIVDWSGPTAYIHTLEVSPQHRRQGIARELLARLEQSAQSAGAAAIWLHVDIENAPAIALYQSLGYQKQGREDHFYGRNRPGDAYSKPLTTNH
jgi:[ribosomal protein S18]-alanine N-acetyltransferase